MNLQKEIEGQNIISSLAIEECKNLYPQLTPYLNKKIQIQTGKSKGFIINHLVQDNVRTYITFEGRNLWLKIDVAVKDKELSGGGYTVNYFKKTIFIGEIDSEGVLKSIDYQAHTTQDLQTLDLEEIKDSIKHYKELSEQLTSIKRKFNTLPDMYFRY